MGGAPMASDRRGLLTRSVSLWNQPLDVSLPQRVQGDQTGLAEEETRRFADLEDFSSVGVLGHVRDEYYDRCGQQPRRAEHPQYPAKSLLLGKVLDRIRHGLQEPGARY